MTKSNVKRITEDSEAIALSYGPTISDGIIAMANLIGKPTPAPTVSAIPSQQTVSGGDLETIIRKIVQEEGVTLSPKAIETGIMLSKKQRGFFQNLNNALIMAMSRENKI